VSVLLALGAAALRPHLLLRDSSNHLVALAAVLPLLWFIYGLAL
jgi:hypothetical protein